MKLFEFFGKPIEELNSDEKHDDPFKLDREERNRLLLDIFDFINNHDNTHKSHFFPIARKIHKSPHKKISPEIWMPLVKKGCMEFYKHHKLKGDPLDLFDEQLRDDLCKKCSEIYNKQILLGDYKLGR